MPAKLPIKLNSHFLTNSFLNDRVQLFRTLVYFFIGLEALLIVFNFNSSVYNPAYSLISGFAVVDYTQWIYPIIWVRLIACFLVAFNLFPNFFKYIAFASVLLHYNGNIAYYNNHFYLEFLLSFLGIFLHFNNNLQARRRNRGVFLTLKWQMSFVYFFTAVVKLNLENLDFLNIIGLLIDFSLAFLTFMAFQRKLYAYFSLFIGITFHTITIFLFNIGVFPFIMISLVYLLFIPKPQIPDFIKRIL